MEKTITIHNAATVKGIGTNASKLCKPVVVVELNKAFDSVTECADYMGVSTNTVSSALNGRAKTIKRKYHVRPLHSVTETVDEILTHNRNAQKKLEDELAALKSEMEGYLAWKKRNEEICRVTENIARLKQEISDAQIKLAEAESYLAELKGGEN